MNIKLINMPFAEFSMPSIALTQLKAITEAMLGDKVSVDIYYLNHDFAGYFTVDQYRFISMSGNSNNSGFGDWLFAKAAHPQVPDNSKAYFMRYGSLIGHDYLQKNAAFLTEKRQDLVFYMDKLIEEYDLANADIVGFTSMFMQNLASLAMARRIKRKNKDIITVMGGANCESPMGEEVVKNFDVIDYVFSGTSLVSFPKFVQCILQGNRTEAEYINGVFTKANYKMVTHSKAAVLAAGSDQAEAIAPVGDELPINECVPLDYDSFLASFDRAFRGKGLKPYLLFETSRGCWWGAKAHCTFCGLNGAGMVYRAMKNDLAVDMINGLIDRYGDRVSHYSSVDNIIPREYIQGVFPRIKKRADTTFFYEVRADLTLEEMQTLADAGVVEMQPGIESLATSTLKLMRKGTSAFNNIRFLQNTVKCSVRPYWNLLVGFPGEEEAVYEKYCKDLPVLYHLPPPAGVFPVRFDRYSPYFMQAEKYNLDLHPLDYYFYNYPLTEEALQTMAYYFRDNNFQAEYIERTNKWLFKMQQKVQEWGSRWANINKGVFPKLYFDIHDGVETILDSRSGESRRYVLTEKEKDILINLDVRKNMAGLHDQLPAISMDCLVQTVERLKNEGFLFEENGTYLNLVFEGEPFLKRLNIFH